MARHSSNAPTPGAAIKPRDYTTIIFDMGGVFAFHSGKGLDLPVGDTELKLILDSPSWHEHERGILSRDECFSRISSDFGVKPKDLAETLERLAATLEFNRTLISFVRDLRRTHQRHVKVYLMTNISDPDWDILRPIVQSWGIFDNTFPSFEFNSRKPDHASYCNVLEKVGIDVRTAIFVDDKPENVMAGQALGMHGIQFESTEDVVAKLSIILGNPLERGEAWMKSQAKDMWSYSNTGVEIKEQFAQLLILHLTGDKSLVNISDAKRTWNVFAHGKPVLTTAYYPDDLDTTTLAFLSLDMPTKVKHEVMDDMLNYVTPDGLFYTYFDAQRPRLDPCVTANVLRLFYAADRGAQVAPSLRYMCRIIATRAYATGTRYYYHPDWFFFYLSDLCARNPTSAHPELGELRRLLTARLRERMGCAGWSDALSAAMRVVAARNLGLDEEIGKDWEIVVAKQLGDGSWGRDAWVYRYGSSKVLFGNRGVVTAMALRALGAGSRVCAAKRTLE